MKISLVSLGCDKNLVDSEYILGTIVREGFNITSAPEEAQVILINTCGFIMDATQESIETILELAAHKRAGTCKALIVTGCMAQRYREEIFKELPEVDAVVGVNDYDKIGRVIREALAGESVALVSDPKIGGEIYPKKRVLSTPSHFAYLKISEGCDNRCTYCTIPDIRGGYRSRDMEGLIAEAEDLASQGVKELILVAQDTALYGKDLYGENRLHILLRSLAQINDIVWIRILYCYPEHITEETMSEISSNSKVCKYLDLPVQHSEDEILRKMGRESSRAALCHIIDRLREKIPGVALRTTLIVGFPGESTVHFNDMSDFISQIKFDRLGVFTYSQEEGTPAAKLSGQVDEKEKRRRQKSIMDLQKEISYRKNQEKIGQQLEVIVDGYLPEQGIYCGRSSADCYEIDGLVYFPCSYTLNSGDFITVRISGASHYDLEGEPV